MLRPSAHDGTPRLLNADDDSPLISCNVGSLPVLPSPHDDVAFTVCPGLPPLP